MIQRHWDDVREGDELAPLRFPLTIYRLVMAAAGNRDFNAIHHNGDYARRSGAPDMYANTLFLQGMWERAVRDYIGLAGTIRRLRGFRMKSFNIVGQTVTVRGKVIAKSREGDLGLVEIELWSENENGVSVGPGSMTVTLPLRDAGAGA